LDGARPMSTINNILTKMTDVNVLNQKEYVERIELLARELINAEFALVWAFNENSNSIETLNGRYKKDMGLTKSIMKEVWFSKKALYHNHILSHKSYNACVDNPLSISLKSMIILPILDKPHLNCIGFITAFNSSEYNYLFKRYDIKVLESLIPYGKISLNQSLYLSTQMLSIKKKENEVDNEKELLLKEELLQKEREILDLKEQIENMELFQEFDAVAQEEIDASLSTLFQPNIEENRNSRVKYEIEIFKDSQSKLHEEIKSHLDFMLNELSYTSQDEQDIYHFLELIKNALHDKGQLQYIEKVLRDKDLIYRLTSDYYKSKSIRVVYKEINVLNLFEDIINLYSINFSNANLTFNVFINPYIPKYLLLDRDLIQSILLPLINNIYAFTNEFGVIELLVDYNYALEELTCQIYGLAEKKRLLNINNIFKKEEIENTLGSSKAGLGLSISTNLITLLKGTLEIEKSEENGESFKLSIPAENFSLDELVDSSGHLELLKIGILMDEKNTHAYKNFLRYMEVFGIEESKLFISSDYRELEGITLTHLFCFENMLHKNMNVSEVSSLIILKYNLYKNYKEYLAIDAIHELYLNSHYGRKLKKLLFPNLIHENLETQSLIIEEKLSSKFKNIFLNKLLK
jgi:signal transduction histidine kinase